MAFYLWRTCSRLPGKQRGPWDRGSLWARLARVQRRCTSPCRNTDDPSQWWRQCCSRRSSHVTGTCRRACARSESWASGWRHLADTSAKSFPVGSNRQCQPTQLHTQNKSGNYINSRGFLTQLFFTFIIPTKARDYVITGVRLSVCLFVCLFVTTITK